MLDECRLHDYKYCDYFRHVLPWLVLHTEVFLGENVFNPTLNTVMDVFLITLSCAFHTDGLEVIGAVYDILLS